MHWLKLARILPVVAVAGCATSPTPPTPPPDYDLLRRQQDSTAAQVTPPSQRLGGSVLVVLESVAAIRRNTGLSGDGNSTGLDRLVAVTDINLTANGSAIEKGRVFDKVTVVRADDGARVDFDGADYRLWVQGYGSYRDKWFLAKRGGDSRELVLPKGVTRQAWLNGLNVAVINAAAELGAPVTKMALPEPPKLPAFVGLPWGGARAAGPSSGTAFFIDGQGHALTNAHVVEGCKTLRLALPEGRKVEALVAAKDSQNDLALLSVTPPHPTFAQFSAKAARQGEDVVAYGFPLAAALSTQGNLTTGIVSALVGLRDDSSKLQISAPVQLGNSGGPLLDNTGAVVGVVTSKINALQVAVVTGDIPQNVNFAIKSAIVANFLETNNVRVERAAGRKAQSVADIGDHARSFTFMVTCER